MSGDSEANLPVWSGGIPRLTQREAELYAAARDNEEVHPSNYIVLLQEISRLRGHMTTALEALIHAR
jgi:hypothetical protein